MNYVIATIKSWNIRRALILQSISRDNFQLIIDRKSLTAETLLITNPEYVFFPHWSWLIPKEIHENFECVVFHETNLPFGRGGSPIQNLIEMGYTKTKITAFRAAEGLDAGPVYLKRDLSLDGSAAEIFNRAADIVFNDMIPEIIRSKLKPVPQQGEVVRFKRRTLEQSDISHIRDIDTIYDHIRMLNAEGYPPAFMETAEFKIEFTEGTFVDGCISTQAKIRTKE